jgi:hypothetical protein
MKSTKKITTQTPATEIFESRQGTHFVAVRMGLAARTFMEIYVGEANRNRFSLAVAH